MFHYNPERLKEAEEGDKLFSTFIWLGFPLFCLTLNCYASSHLVAIWVYFLPIRSLTTAYYLIIQGAKEYLICFTLFNCVKRELLSGRKTVPEKKNYVFSRWMFSGSGSLPCMSTGRKTNLANAQISPLFGRNEKF